MELKPSRWHFAALAAGAGLALAANAIRKRATSISLRGQVVLITGGSRGLGLRLAMDLAARGCRIAICARDAEELKRAAEKIGGEVLTVVGDVSARGDVEFIVERTMERFGRIDVLINNAAHILVGPIAAMTPEDFEHAMQVMFWGPFYFIHTLLPQMSVRGEGHIVNITSIGGKVPVPHLVAYCAAKHALVGLSESLATELQGSGVQVLTVVPGLMRTGSHVNAKFKGRQEEEYRWFSIGASMPGLAMSATRASEQIISSIERSDTHCILTANANGLARLHGSFPEFTMPMLAAANSYLLPGSSSSGKAVKGSVAEKGLNSFWHKLLVGMGTGAAASLNEY